VCTRIILLKLYGMTLVRESGFHNHVRMRLCGNVQQCRRHRSYSPYSRYSCRVIYPRFVKFLRIHQEDLLSEVVLRDTLCLRQLKLQEIHVTKSMCDCIARNKDLVSLVLYKCTLEWNVLEYLHLLLHTQLPAPLHTKNEIMLSCLSGNICMNLDPTPDGSVSLIDTQVQRVHLIVSGCTYLRRGAPGSDNALPFKDMKEAFSCDGSSLEISHL